VVAAAAAAAAAALTCIEMMNLRTVSATLHANETLSTSRLCAAWGSF
jgi:hypothetical protein